jgi:hypothetical protein
MNTVWKFVLAGLLVCGVPAVGIAQAGSLLGEMDAADKAESDATAGTISNIRQMGSGGIRKTESEQAEARANIKGIGEMMGHFGKFLGAANSGSAMYSAMDALDKGECVPDLAADAGGLMPSGCDESGDCSQCYESAVSRMNTVRKNLARMSCLKVNTKRYVESAVAFGDNVSGIHGAMGLAWQHQRKGIKASYEKFKKTYDGKYVEMMESLGTSLKGIDVCEAQFGMKDWYQKSGFIYFELMKEKYKRTD